MRLREALLAATLTLTTPILAGEKPDRDVQANRMANSARVEKALLDEVRGKIKRSDRCRFEWRQIEEDTWPIDMGPEEEAGARERLANPQDAFFTDADPIESGYYFEARQITLMCVRAVLGDDLKKTEEKDDLQCATGAITRFPVEHRLQSGDPTNWLICATCR